MRIAFVGDSLTEGRPGSSYLTMLRARLPGHALINLGEWNDTVVSLYRRLVKLRFDEPFDLAFLWVGMNDVAGGSPWTFQAVSALLRKPRAKDLDEFRVYYQATLDLLCRNARQVITVSPLLRGEDVNNPWNHELECLANVVAELTSQHQQAKYLDLRTVFIEKLTGKHTSSYLPQSVIRVALDALTLRSDKQIDRKAAERGLHLTLDGIHLNSAGAQLVAETLLQVI